MTSHQSKGIRKKVSAQQHSLNVSKELREKKARDAQKEARKQAHQAKFLEDARIRNEIARRKAEEREYHRQWMENRRRREKIRKRKALLLSEGKCPICELLLSSPYHTGCDYLTAQDS